MKKISGLVIAGRDSAGHYGFELEISNGGESYYAWAGNGVADKLRNIVLLDKWVELECEPTKGADSNSYLIIKRFKIEEQKDE
ncbi:MAG: hypothetical protein OXB93_02100 [Cytophagales bacterium]|nr:hypothetical protein [Cytophagales bacterium]